MTLLAWYIAGLVSGIPILAVGMYLCDVGVRWKIRRRAQKEAKITAQKYKEPDNPSEVTLGELTEANVMVDAECFGVVLAKSETGFTVTVPALPGIVTEGRNLGEAITMAEDAIRCYREGMEKLLQCAKGAIPLEPLAPELPTSSIGPALPKN